MATLEEAQNVIQKLRESHGDLDDEMVTDLQNNWNPKYYKNLDKYRTIMEGLASHSIKTCVFKNCKQHLTFRTARLTHSS